MIFYLIGESPQEYRITVISEAYMGCDQKNAFLCRNIYPRDIFYEI